MLDDSPQREASELTLDRRAHSRTRAQLPSRYTENAADRSPKRSRSTTTQVAPQRRAGVTRSRRPGEAQELALPLATTVVDRVRGVADRIQADTPRRDRAEPVARLGVGITRRLLGMRSRTGGDQAAEEDVRWSRARCSSFVSPWTNAGARRSTVASSARRSSGAGRGTRAGAPGPRRHQHDRAA